MRLGILGGSFDPVHYGHLLLAECCREDCSLDQVWLVPTAVSPHKQDQQPAPARARVDMLELAIGGHPQLVVCQIELQRGGVSYTVDTLEAIARQHPDAELFLLMGSDTLNDLPQWRQPARICQLALPVVVGRQGSAQPNWAPLARLVTASRLGDAQGCRVEMPRVELSSREVRRRVAAGRSVRYWTPRAVEQYIQTHQLYQAPSASR